jgi:hypothetical protein
MPATLKKYQALQRKKKSYCAGRATKADVKRAASVYVTAAVAKGQTKQEAQRKADRVMKSGCSMTANIAGRKRKTTTAKRKSTGTRKTTTTKRKTATRSRSRARA